MTSFNKTSKCALSILLAVMMLFTSVLTGADALTKTAQDTAQAAFEAAVDTEAEAAAATAAANEAEDAAQADETAPEQDASATAQETAQPDAEETAQTQTVKTDAAEPETETVRTDVSVKKTPEKSGDGTRDITIYYDNSGCQGWFKSPKIYYWGTNISSNGWNSTSMNTVSTNVYSYTVENVPTSSDLNFIISGYNNGDSSIIRQTVNLSYSASESQTKIWSYVGTTSTERHQIGNDWYDKLICNVSSYDPDNTDGIYGVANYKIMYSTTEDNVSRWSDNNGSANYALLRYDSANSQVYADIDISSFGTSNVYFALYNSYDNTIVDPTNQKSVSVSSDYTSLLQCDANTKDYSGTNHHGVFSAKSSDAVQKVRVVVNLNNGSFSTYTLSVSQGGYNLYAKDGTIRTNTTYFHQKYSNFCDTTIVSIGDNTSPTKASETYYEKANVSAGDVVTIKTTIAAPYNNAYYVKGFCVNGVTYGSIEEPGTADSRRTSKTGGEYTLTYTIPENFTYIEITPIYFYFENGGMYSDLGFITFHVEKYTEGIQEQWGNTISCQTWYTDGVESSYNLDAATQNSTQNALGGFPGQPLVYENGDFYMQVPKKLPVNGDTASVTVQGMTLSNYYWDDVHQELAKKDSDFRGKHNTNGKNDHRCYNSQTYDYNDFEALAKMGAEDIIFTFKYRTKLFNRQNVDASYLNNFSGILNVKYKDGWNGWDGLVDYHDRAVDVSGHILTNPTTNAPYTESDLVDSDADSGDGNKTYTPAEAAKMIWIVSKGYQDIKATTGNGYYGNYATSWDFYKYVNGSGFVKINTDYSLPGSSFVPPETAYETVDEDGHLPTDTVGDDYYDHDKYETNKTRYLAFSDNATSYKTATYDEFVKVYNETLGKLTMISFEQSKLAYANYNGEEEVSEINYGSGITNYTSSVKYNNPAYRCDGRWYYSTADSGDVKAHLLIEYKNSVATSYTKDTYTDSGVGVTTGATLRFTTPDNDDAAKVWKDTSGVHAVDTYSSDEYFAFNAPSYSTGTNGKVYKFVGWYLLIGSNYTPINPADIANVNGKHVRNVTNNYVARYEEISGEYAIIDHRVIMNSAGTAAKGGGNGSAYTTVQVYNGDTLVKTYSKTQGAVQIPAQDLSEYSSYNFVITLTAEPNDYSGYIGTYSDSTGTTSLTNTEGDGLNNGWTNKDTIIWSKKYTGDDLSELAGTQDNRTITFYSDFDLHILNVTYKYYDRALTANAAVDISDTVTNSTIDVSVPYKAGQTVSDIILNGLNQKVGDKGSVSSVRNILDEYYIWSTQAEATGNTGIKSLPDYTVDQTGNTKYSAGSYTFTNHFNNIGKPATDGEQWVNYTFIEGKDHSGAESTYTPENVSAVTVWAFNTPKLYELKFFYPNEESVDNTTAELLSNNVLPNNTDIYCIPEGSATESYLLTETTFYGQRLGVAIGDVDNNGVPTSVDKNGIPVDERNKPGTHIANYGIKLGYTGKQVIAKQSIEGTAGNYLFDGWYDVDTGAKIATDYDYGYRVTTGLKLAAGYKFVANGGTDTRSTDIGVSLTANDYDYYFTTGTSSVTEHIRYNTELNVYNSEDSNKNITDTAIVYIRMRVQGAGSPYTTEYAKSLLSDVKFMSTLRSDIEAKFATGSVSGSTTTTYKDKLVAIEYYYAYSNDAGGLTLNNKNRGMFTTSFTISEVSTNAPYSAILAFGAIKVNNVETNGGWVLSDNFIEYVDVTKQ